MEQELLTIGTCPLLQMVWTDHTHRYPHSREGTTVATVVRSSSARSLLHRKFERYANQRSTISYHMLLAKDVAFDLVEKVVSGLKVNGGVTKVKCCHKGRQTNQGRKFWLYTITGGYSGWT